MPAQASLIVAAAENSVIGNKGHIPWQLSADLQFFKATTTGHAIIMGRTTFESIGKALPNRINIVLSKNEGFEAPGCEVAASFSEAFEKAGGSELFIIGGANVYKQALAQNIADRIYLTRVHASPEGDTFFEFDKHQWLPVAREFHAADETNQYPFTIYTLKQKRYN